MTVRFTADELERANRDWGCSCGPAAMAAICGLTLDEARRHFQPAFPGWTTPTRMKQALLSAGARSTATITTLRPGSARDQLWPRWGLARVQWCGPWTSAGASPRWAYRHTHWVGVSRLRLMDGAEDPRAVCVWDANELGPPRADGWSPLAWWAAEVAPRLIAEIPRASGRWFVTHAIEVERPGVPA